MPHLPRTCSSVSSSAFCVGSSGGGGAGDSGAGTGGGVGVGPGAAVNVVTHLDTLKPQLSQGKLGPTSLCVPQPRCSVTYLWSLMPGGSLGYGGLITMGLMLYLRQSWTQR